MRCNENEKIIYIINPYLAKNKSGKIEEKKSHRKIEASTSRSMQYLKAARSKDENFDINLNEKGKSLKVFEILLFKEQMKMEKCNFIQVVKIFLFIF